MNWLVEFQVNDKIEAEEHNSLDSAKVAYKHGRKLFLDLAEITPRLRVSGKIIEVDGKNFVTVDQFNS